MKPQRPDLEAETCTCPAYAQGKTRPCKHQVAVVLSLWLREKRERAQARTARAAERPVA